MSAPELAPGQIVASKYGIQTLLGHSGPMATYHALTAPNRQVALKLYDPALKSLPDLLKTLGRYQMTTAALESKLIAPILEIGEDPITGAVFTVTELEANPSLASLVELCPLSMSEMVTLMGTLGRAVDLLHSHGIVHLALHPKNVVVGPAPGYEARILDFGSGVVRKALRSQENLDAMAPWLAPEQARDGYAWDARIDVFAAALIAFFAVTGRSYWRSSQKGATDMVAWQRELVGARVRASQRAEELSVAMSPAFDAVFERALAVSPSDRFSSVGEFAAALAHAQSGGVHAFSAGGAGAPVYADIPVPPAQMEAVLSAFEAGSQFDRGRHAATTSVSDNGGASTAGVSAPVAVSELSEESEDARGRAKRRSRFRVAIAAGFAALLIGMGGAMALLSGPKKDPSHADTLAAATKPARSSVPAVETPPPPPALPVAEPAAIQQPLTTNEAPPPAPEPSTLALAAAAPAAAAPVAAAPAPARTRTPVVRRPAPAPRAPAKKQPCGKFLKRCP